MEVNKIYQGDCLEVLKTFPDESIDCVITSPPYNKGYFGKRVGTKHDCWKQRNIDYGDFKDNLDWNEYSKQQELLLKELVRIIKPNGSIFYNHKGQPHKHKLYFPEWVFKFNLRQVLIWNRKSCPSLMPIRWFPTTEYVFWITKTNIQPKFYRRSKHDKEVIEISPKPMKDHPAPFPEELVETLLFNTTDNGDLVLDPYLGSGTTALVAKNNNRNYVGIELNPEYIKLAEKRLCQQTLI